MSRRVRPRLQLIGGLGGFVPGVDPDAAQIVTQPGFEIIAGGNVELPATA